MFRPPSDPSTLLDEIRVQGVCDRLARREFTRQCALAATVPAAPQPVPALSVHVVVPTQAEPAVVVDDLALLDDLALERFEFMYSSQREEISVFSADAY